MQSKINHVKNMPITEGPGLLLWQRRTEVGDAGAPASRDGFPLRGIEELVRDAGAFGARSSAEIILPVRCGEDVAWDKPIRVAGS